MPTSKESNGGPRRRDGDNKGRKNRDTGNRSERRERALIRLSEPPRLHASGPHRVPHRYGWLCKQDGRKVDRIARSRVTIIYLPAGPERRVSRANTYPPANKDPHAEICMEPRTFYARTFIPGGSERAWWRSDSSGVTHETRSTATKKTLSRGKARKRGRRGENRVKPGFLVVSIRRLRAISRDAQYLYDAYRLHIIARLRIFSQIHIPEDIIEKE